MEQKNNTNPTICPETNCECLLPYPDSNLLDRGCSIICVGKKKDLYDIEVITKGVYHDNTHHFCVWTHVRGWSKFHVNNYDMISFIYLANLILNDIQKDELFVTPKRRPTVKDLINKLR